MARENPLMLDVPELTFLAHFWKNVLDDYHGRGCTSDDLPAAQRRLPYKQRVMIEREQLAKDAAAFLDSPDFEAWALLSDLDPSVLKEAIIHDRLG